MEASSSIAYRSWEMGAQADEGIRGDLGRIPTTCCPSQSIASSLPVFLLTNHRAYFYIPSSDAVDFLSLPFSSFLPGSLFSMFSVSCGQRGKPRKSGGGGSLGKWDKEATPTCMAARMLSAARDKIANQRGPCDGRLLLVQEVRCQVV